MPVRFVLGTGLLSGAIWTMTRPSDKPLVLAAEAEEAGKKKALVRTASGAVRTPAPLHHPAHSRGIKRHSKHPLRGRRVAGAAPSRLHQSSLLRCGQIPPGLQGTESEAMYAKRMGMAKNDAKL